MIKKMQPEEASELVRNALARDPQDELEAAVILEAWGGVAPSRSLVVGDVTVTRTRAAPVEVDELEVSEEKKRTAAVGVAVLVAIIAMAVWAVPLSRTYGGSNVANAWRLALPITLALQSWFTVRHGSKIGLGSMPGNRVEYVIASLAAVAALAWLPWPMGPLAILFVLTWTTGAVVVQRGWFIAFAAANIAVAVALLAGAEPLVALGITMAVMLSAAIVASFDSKAHIVAGPNSRAVLAGVTGMLLGIILIIDPSIEWNSAGYVPVLALIPALVGNVWAATYLSRLWRDIPQYLLAYQVGADTKAVGPLAWQVISRAMFRFMGAAIPLSVIVVAIIHASGVAVDRAIILLAGLSMAMIASLGLILLDVFGRRLRALVAAASGCAASVTVALVGHYPFAGFSLMSGALLTVVLAANPIHDALTHPDRTLATAMLLP